MDTCWLSDWWNQHDAEAEHECHGGVNKNELTENTVEFYENCVVRFCKCDFLVQEQFLSLVSSRVAPWALYCTLAIPSRCLLSPEVSRGTKCSGGCLKRLIHEY